MWGDFNGITAVCIWSLIKADFDGVYAANALPLYLLLSFMTPSVHVSLLIMHSQYSGGQAMCWQTVAGSCLFSVTKHKQCTNVLWKPLLLWFSSWAKLLKGCSGNVLQGHLRKIKHSAKHSYSSKENTCILPLERTLVVNSHYYILFIVHIKLQSYGIFIWQVCTSHYASQPILLWTSPSQIFMRISNMLKRSILISPTKSVWKPIDFRSDSALNVPLPSLPPWHLLLFSLWTEFYFHGAMSCRC